MSAEPTPKAPTVATLFLSAATKDRAALRRAHGGLTALRPRLTGKPADHLDAILHDLDAALRRADEHVAQGMRVVKLEKLPAHSIPTALAAATALDQAAADDDPAPVAQLTLITGGKT